jgi:hypothetical protein
VAQRTNVPTAVALHEADTQLEQELCAAAPPFKEATVSTLKAAWQRSRRQATLLTAQVLRLEQALEDKGDVAGGQAAQAPQAASAQGDTHVAAAARPKVAQKGEKAAKKLSGKKARSVTIVKKAQTDAMVEDGRNAACPEAASAENLEQLLSKQAAQADTRLRAAVQEATQWKQSEVSDLRARTTALQARLQDALRANAAATSDTDAARLKAAAACAERDAAAERETCAQRDLRDAEVRAQDQTAVCCAFLLAPVLTLAVWQIWLRACVMDALLC